MKTLVIAVALATAAVPLAAAAHHSPAAFNLDKRITVTGVLQKVEFRNPHTHLVVQGKGPDGKVQAWNVESSAANLLIRRGWKFSQVKVGQTVTVSGYPTKKGDAMLFMREIRLPTGVTFGDPKGTNNSLD